MTNIKTPFTKVQDAEIYGLIDSMNKAALRLEELTAGEIDSVAGPNGHMVLLQHAQEQLRMNQAIRQATILNALPAHIALLDTEGVIISVNEGWGKFTTSNMLRETQYSLGHNYLKIFDQVIGKDAFDAQQVANGIRSVLDGTQKSFMIEYPSHSASKEHWFLMTVTPLTTDKPIGAVVMHLDISQRKHAEEKLRRLALAIDGTADAIYLVDRTTMKYVHVNDAACLMNNKSREDLIKVPPWEVSLTTRSILESSYDEIIASGVAAKSVELLRKRGDGPEIWVELRQQAHLSDGYWKIITVERDISERKEADIRLHRMAHFDVLTGLPNRKMFYDTLTKCINATLRSKRSVCVMFIDLDHFKIVNDTLGHAIGDELLIQFSSRLVKCVRIRDTVGRLGGDEFAIILVQEDEAYNPAIVANKIREMLRTPFDLKGHETTVTASIGITVHPIDALDTDTLIKYADTAMYRAKQSGRDTYRFFTAQMNTEVLARVELENALHKALAKDEFVLHYQPKVDIKTGLITGLEALIRWKRPHYGLVSPAEFIPALEETGLIVAVGHWVITEACKQIRLWMHSNIGPIQVAVNVSSRQFVDGDIHDDIFDALSANDVPANLLELEITEGTLMVNTERTIKILQTLKNKGVQISIDDFGTGYSSLAYLRRFPIDKLKIDIAFIRNITSNEDDAAITQAIIQMAHSLNLEVIAEGVETVEQLECLKVEGSDYIQGYLISQPLPADQIGKLLQKQSGLSLFEVP